MVLSSSTYRPVSKLLSESSVGGVEFVQLDRLASSLCILNLDCPNTTSAEIARIELTRGEAFASGCGHGVHGRKERWRKYLAVSMRSEGGASSDISGLVQRHLR
jgi:hypothetical protein